MPRRVAHQGKRRRRLTFLRQWRDYRGLTQDALANRLEMSSAQLSRIENGEQPYTQDFLEAAAHALQTDAVSLLIRDPSDPEGLWSIWDQAKPGERADIIEHAKVIVRKTAS